MRVFKLLIATGLIAAGATAVLAQDLAADREATMKKVGGAFGAVNKMNRGQSPYDGAAAAEAFTTISTSAKHFATLFPADGKAAGRSLPSIWEKKADFDARVEKLASSSAAAATEAAKGEAEFKAAFATIGPQCGSCHETYRGEKP
ncbi:cytochrome c-556 [Terrihabitans soli]|uniref:Cytochrome c-556 n=1 Tax=Terrihabitans soli TaxID=708113 RepID=A0A6S6QP51_9HYPH|nr:cytochrome c [Terrihabitans soli]BCJ92334.1 cytochrome c-556 [Terrihabitans soli]